MGKALIPLEQTERLRRENWQGQDGATRLSQEIYAILEAVGVIDVDGPVTIRQPSADVPALTIVPYPDATVPAVNIPGGGGGGGGLSPTQITFPSTPATGSLPTSLPVVMYGVVQSKVGGSVYVVRCWMTDPGSGIALGDFQVIQGQIDPTETIPAGTQVFVWMPISAGFIAGPMRMLVPVFLGPPA